MTERAIQTAECQIIEAVSPFIEANKEKASGSSQVKQLSTFPCVIGCPSVTDSATTAESFQSKE